MRGLLVLLFTTVGAVGVPHPVLGRQGEPRSPVLVYGVGVPSAATARWGTRSTVVFRVSVRNDSSDAAAYLIRVELEGVATSSATSISSIPAGTIARIPVDVDVDLRSVPSGGERLPFTVTLLDARRQPRNRFAGTLPVIRVVPSLVPDLTAPRALVFARDIATTRIEYQAPSERRGHPGGFVVVVKNRGREVWAYLGSLGGEIGMGTPESHIERSRGLSLVSAALPRGLARGDSAVILLRLSPVAVSSPGVVAVVPHLPTELWITVRVYVASSFDVNSSNDALYYVLRLNSNGTIAEARTLPAPPLTVRVIPQ